MLAVASTVSIFSWQAASAPLPGLAVPAKMTVGDSVNTFAIADANYLNGGHMQVANRAALLAITRERRSNGMMVTVIDDDNGTGGDQTVTYRLIDNPTADGSGGTPTNTLISDWAVIMPSFNGNAGKFLTTDGNEVSWETVVTSGGTITEGANLGTGAEVYSGINGTALEFRTFVAGVGLSITQATNDITLANTGVLSFNGSTGAITLASGDVTTALGYTPYNATNPSNYISRAGLSATAPLSYNNTTGVFSIAQATTSTNGYLSATDWNTFNNKLDASSFVAGGSDTQVQFNSGGAFAGSSNFTWDANELAVNEFRFSNNTVYTTGGTDININPDGVFSVDTNNNGTINLQGDGGISLSTDANNISITGGDGGHLYLNTDGTTELTSNGGDLSIFATNSSDAHILLQSDGSAYFRGTNEVLVQNTTYGNFLQFNSDGSTNLTAENGQALSISTNSGDINLFGGLVRLNTISSSVVFADGDGYLTGTGVVSVAQGGTGATTLNNLIALGTHTTGNYVATVAGSGPISVLGSGSENAGVTVSISNDSIGDTQLTYNTGQHLTTASAPTFAALNISGQTIITDTVGSNTTSVPFIIRASNGTDINSWAIRTASPVTSGGNSSYTLDFPFASGIIALRSDITSAVSGTTNYISKFTGSNILGNSLLYDNGSSVGIGTTSFTSAIAGTDVLQISNGTSTFGFNFNSNNPFISVSNGTVKTLLHASGTEGAVFGAYSNNNAVIRTNNINRVVVTNGSMNPAVNNSYDLGTSSFRYQNLYANSGIFTTSVSVGGNSVLTTTNVSGSTNYIPKFTGANSIGDSIISDTGSDIAINGGIDANGNIRGSSGGTAKALLGNNAYFSGDEAGLYETNNGFAIAAFDYNDSLFKYANGAIISGGGVLYGAYDTGSALYGWEIGATGDARFRGLQAGSAGMGVSGTLMLIDGSTGYGSRIAVVDNSITNDRDLYIPDETGTIATREWTGGQGFLTGNQTITLSGDIAGSGTTAITTTIQSNAVALATDTTGNYIATITGGAQIGVSGGTGENIAIGLSINNDSIGDTQLAFNTGQHLTTGSSPSFAGLTVGGSSVITTASISGTPDYIAKFTGSNSLGDSLLYDDTGGVGIGTTTLGGYRFRVEGGDTWLRGQNLRVGTTGNGPASITLFDAPTNQFKMTYDDTNFNPGRFIMDGTNQNTNDVTTNIIFNPYGGNVGVGIVDPQSKLEIGRVDSNYGDPTTMLTLTRRSDDNSSNNNNSGASILFRSADVDGNDIELVRLDGTIQDPNYDEGGRYGDFAINLMQQDIGGFVDRLHIKGNTGNVLLGTSNDNFEGVLQVGGTIVPTSDMGGNLGSASYRWGDVYANNGFFNDTVYIGGNVAWHANNDGSGSGLDADLLDGHDTSYFATAGAISGTTNYIPKFTSGSTIGNSIIYQSGSGIGIGTTSPDAVLTVQPYLSIKNTGGSARGYLGTGISGADTTSMTLRGETQILFSIAGSDKAVIDSSGNVGVGTATLGTDKLRVAGNVTAYGGKVTAGNSGFGQVELGYDDGSNLWLKTVDSNRNLVLQAHGTGSVIINDDVRFDGSATSVGTIIANSAGSNIYLKSSGTHDGGLYMGSDVMYLADWGTASGLRIATPSGAATFTNTLTVTGATTINNDVVVSTSNNTPVIYATTTGSGNLLQLAKSGTDKLYVDNNGAIVSSGSIRTVAATNGTGQYILNQSAGNIIYNVYANASNEGVVQVNNASGTQKIALYGGSGDGVFSGSLSATYATFTDVEPVVTINALGASNTARLYLNPTVGYLGIIGTQNASPLSLVTGGVARVTIDTSGITTFGSSVNVNVSDYGGIVENGANVIRLLSTNASSGGTNEKRWDIEQNATGKTLQFRAINDAYSNANSFMNVTRSGFTITNLDLYGTSVTANGSNIWTQGNDGSGSLLDADLLDGHDTSYFATASSLGSYLPLSGGDVNGATHFYSNKGVVSLNASDTPSLQAYSNDTGPAFMSFHRGGAFAINMGLDYDNVFRIGGWSAPANLLELDMNGNLRTKSLMADQVNSNYSDPTTMLTLTRRSDDNSSNSDNSGASILFKSADIDNNDIEVVRLDGTIQDPNYDQYGRFGDFAINVMQPDIGGFVDRLHIKGNTGNVLLSSTSDNFEGVLQANGNIVPTNDFGGSLGTTTYRWNEVNANIGYFGDLYVGGNPVLTSASVLGTTNYIPKFTSGSAIGNSLIYDNGSGIGIGTTGPTRTFEIAGNLVNNTSGSASQMSIRGTGSTSHKLNIGYNTTSNFGFIEAVNQSVAWENLILQPTAGKVGIGTMPSYTLDVNGDIHAVGTYYGNGGGLTNIQDYAIAYSGSNDIFIIGSQQTNVSGGSEGNTALGYNALISNTDGATNTAIGVFALQSNLTGSDNVAVGNAALSTSTTAQWNVAVGAAALQSLGTGTGNVGVGDAAVPSLTSGNYNLGIGYNTLTSLSTGSNNVAIGPATLNNLTSGSGNIAIGQAAYVASATGSNQLSIGNLIYGTGLDGTGTTISSGSIGIGTKAPGAKLEIVGDANSIILRAPTSSSYGSLRIYNDQNSSSRALEIGYGGSAYASALISGGMNGETAYITTTGSKGLQFGTGNTFRMGIDTNGRVGIGTPAPGYNLDVNGNVHASSAIYSDSIIMGSGGSGRAFIGNGCVGTCDETGLYEDYNGTSIASYDYGDGQYVFAGGQFTSNGAGLNVNEPVYVSGTVQNTVYGNLGGTTGNYKTLNRVTGNGQTNSFMINDFLVRESTGTDWQSTSYVRGVSVDASFLTPSTLRSWIKQYPNAGKVSFGDAATEYAQFTGNGLALNPSNSYLNFTGTLGSSGYGIRDNSGTMQYKNSAGSWTNIGSGGGTPAGSNTQIQFNNSGAFGASSNFTWDNGSNQLTIRGGMDVINNNTGNTMLSSYGGGSSGGFSIYNYLGSDMFNLYGNSTDNYMYVSNPAGNNFISANASSNTVSFNMYEPSTGNQFVALSTNASSSISSFEIDHPDASYLFRTQGNSSSGNAEMGFYTSIGYEVFQVLGNGGSASSEFTLRNAYNNSLIMNVAGDTTNTGLYMYDENNNPYVQFVSNNDSFIGTQNQSNYNFGLGTDSPQTKLHIMGSAPDLRIESNSGSNDIERISFLDNASGELAYIENHTGHATFTIATSHELELTTLTSQAINLSTNGNLAMQITANQDVGIGGISPSYRLDVSNTGTAGPVLRITNANASCTIDPDQSPIPYSCSSDMRLKKDIETVEGDALPLLAQLRAVTYRWNAELESDPTHVGFIAQDIEQVFPEFVSTNADGYKTVAFGGLMPYMIKGIQELDIKVQSLPTFEDQTFAEKVATFLQGIAERGEALVDSVKTKKVTTEQLCVGTDEDQVCVSKEQLEQLLQNGAANAGGASGGSSNDGSGDEQTPPPADDGGGEVTSPSEETPPVDEGGESAPADEGSGEASAPAPSEGE